MPSAQFQIDPGSGIFAPAGEAVDALPGATVRFRIVDTNGINPSLIKWSFFGNHSSAVTNPAIALSGSPNGQIATVVLPAGTGQAYGPQLDVNGGVGVTRDNLTTAKSAVYVLFPNATRPYFINESFEGNPTHACVERFNLLQEVVGGTGEANTAANVGGKPGEVFRDKVGAVINLKTIDVTAPLAIIDNADDIGVSIAAASGVTAGTMSSADFTKLAGVEALADVTDTANVSAAGAIMETLIDAKGDILVGAVDNSIARLPVGTDGQFLRANSAETSGVQWTDPPIEATQIASATGDTTTTSATDVLMATMTITPGVGTYFVNFGGSVESSSNNDTIECNIYANAIISAASERRVEAGNASGISNVFMCQAIVTVADAQAIEGRWRRIGAGTATSHERTLIVIPAAP